MMISTLAPFEMINHIDGADDVNVTPNNDFREDKKSPRHMAVLKLE